jgi:predicted dehydrogenase
VSGAVTSIKYGYEYDRRIRVGLIGCGGHAFTGILPAFQYTPFDLVATCDLDPARARGVARQYHATGGTYTDYAEMLQKEQLDAVFIIISYPDGLPRYPEIASAAMEAGCHVWMEKPPGRTAEEVRSLIAARDRTGKTCMVGLKKIFLPTVEKMKEVSERPEFGPIGTAAATYPIHLPPLEERRRNPASVRNFLDHIWHPGAILHYLCGDAASITYETTEDEVGGGASIIEFKSGAVGIMYHAQGRPQGAHVEVERYELVGSNNKIIVRNSTELVWYRGYARERVPYSQVWNFIEGDDSAALAWTPEMSRSAAYNNSMFLNGTGQEVVYFGECLLDGRQPEKSTLEDCLELVKWYEAHFDEPGRPVKID